jgi:hypothetical protein
MERGPTGHAPPPGRQRVLAGVVAFLLFGAAGAFAWAALRPSAPIPTGGGTGSPLPTPVYPRTAIGPACGIYELRADFDGDARPDTLLTYAPTDPGVSCEDPDLTLAYRMAVFLADGRRFEEPVPDCTWPTACRPLAGPDLDGDGRPDIALQVMAGASTVQVELFATVGTPWSGTIARLSVAAPGDPEGGFAPGPASFELYGSVTHQGALRCLSGGDGLPILRYTKATMREPGTFSVHETEFVLDGSVLSVVGVRDSTVSEQAPGFGRLEQGSAICGAALNNDGP